MFFRLSVLWPMMKLSWAGSVKADRWFAITYPLSPEMFGPGSRESFDHYLHPPLKRPAKTLESIKSFLLDCEYKGDEELFGVIDHWLHPCEFEISRQGDCDDHALWAWRNLVGMGVAAELMVGQWNPDGSPDQHAWVVFRDRGRAWLLESVAKHDDLIVRPLEVAKPYYSPHFSVDQRLVTRIYGGALRYKNRGKALWAVIFAVLFFVFFLGFQLASVVA